MHNLYTKYTNSTSGNHSLFTKLKDLYNPCSPNPATAVENILQIHTPFTNVLYDKSRYDK